MSGAVAEARYLESARWFHFISDGDEKLIGEYAERAGCKTDAERWGFRTLEANWLAVAEMAGQLLQDGSLRRVGGRAAITAVVANENTVA